MHHSIEVEKLSFAYPDGHVALREVSLSIQPDEKVALVGPNGAGKSTLLLHLNGILSGEGTVRVCDVDASKGNLGRLRAMVGLVFQSPEDQLFSPKVFDDVAFGPLNLGKTREEAFAIVQDVLTRLGLKGFEERLTYKLSGGEKRLVSLATVLAMHPEVLILDEPSNGLDEATIERLVHMLRTSNLTYLIASHNNDLLAKTTDVIYRLSKGTIVRAPEARKSP